MPIFLPWGHTSLSFINHSTNGDQVFRYLSLWGRSHSDHQIIIPVFKAQYIIELAALITNESKVVHFIKTLKEMKLSGWFQSALTSLHSWATSILEEKLTRNDRILFLLWKCGSQPWAYRTPVGFRGPLLPDPPCRGQRDKAGAALTTAHLPASAPQVNHRCKKHTSF